MIALDKIKRSNSNLSEGKGSTITTAFVVKLREGQLSLEDDSAAAATANFDSILCHHSDSSPLSEKRYRTQSEEEIELVDAYIEKTKAALIKFSEEMKDLDDLRAELYDSWQKTNRGGDSHTSFTCDSSKMTTKARPAAKEGFSDYMGRPVWKG